jgi:septum formation inhibitor MinC
LAGGNVDFKANANGLVIVFDKDESFDGIYAQISKKLESSGFFFQTRYLATQYRGRKLPPDEEIAISKMMASKTGAKTVIFEHDEEYEKDMARAATAARAKSGDAGVAGNARGAGQPAGVGAGAVLGDPPRAGAGVALGAGADADFRLERDAGRSGGPGVGAKGSGAFAANRTFDFDVRGAAFAGKLKSKWTSYPDLDECMTKYVRGTLRSGKFVSYEGNLVVIGDVNPGAEVEATGSIIVLGNLRGIVHAGASGNKEATIIALNLFPTQLRIADIITRPQTKRNQKISPEIASIRGDSIVIEALM